MPPQEQTVTFTASRTLILAGMIALLVGTGITGKGFADLASAVFKAQRFASAMIFVLILYLAVLGLLSFFVLLSVRALLRPRQLTITGDGITEWRDGQVRSERWENLSNPVKKLVSYGNASVFIIELEQVSAEPFAVRADIYPESFDQILTVIKDAMAGRVIAKPVPDTQTRNHLLLAFAAMLSILALVHAWVK